MWQIQSKCKSLPRGLHNTHTHTPRKHTLSISTSDLPRLLLEKGYPIADISVPGSQEDFLQERLCKADWQSWHEQPVFSGQREARASGRQRHSLSSENLSACSTHYMASNTPVTRWPESLTPKHAADFTEDGRAEERGCGPSGPPGVGQGSRLLV